MNQIAPIQSAANFRAEREVDWEAFEALLDRLVFAHPKG